MLYLRAVLNEEWGLEKDWGVEMIQPKRLGAKDFTLGVSKETIGLWHQKLGSTLTCYMKRLGLRWSGEGKEHRWLEAGGDMADELMSGVFIYLITCHTSQEAKRQFMFLTSAHQQASSGSVSLRGWQPMTGSGTPLVPLAEICANMQFSFCWGKRGIEMEFVSFQLVFILPSFFLLKKINTLLKNITKIAKSSNWNKEIAESNKLCLFCLINFS